MRRVPVLTLSLLAAAAVLPACPQTILVIAGDGGLGLPDGSAFGTDASPGVDSGRGPDSGNNIPSDAGTTAADAGSSLTWSNMLTQSTSQPYAVWGSSSTNVYVVGSSGVMQHYNGSGWSNVYQDPSNLDLHGVWVDPNGAVYAVGYGQLLQCPGSCTQQSAFTSLSISNQILMDGVCGSVAGTAYAVGDDSNNNGYLYQWTGGAWNQLSANTGIVAATGCWVDASGNVFIAGQSYVWKFAGGALTQEQNPDYNTWSVSDVANQYWNAIWGNGTSVFASGSRRRIITRLSNGTWTFQPPGFNPNGVDDFYAIAGWTSAEVYAAGTGDVTGEEAALLTGGMWNFIQDLYPGGVYVYGMWAAGPNEYFAVGVDSASGIYILHGTR